MAPTRCDRGELMNPGHEDCTHETVEEKTLCSDGAMVQRICLHDHREPVYASDGILQHVVGFHCHCCGGVWNDHSYIERGPRD